MREEQNSQYHGLVILYFTGLQDWKELAGRSHHSPLALLSPPPPHSIHCLHQQKFLTHLSMHWISARGGIFSLSCYHLHQILVKKGKEKKKRVSLTCVEICYWKLEEDFNHFLVVLGEGLICLGFSYR